MSKNNRFKADVCVIGAGIVGLTTALILQAKKYKVVIVEAKGLGQNASTNNAGQLLPFYALPENKIASLFGESYAKQLVALASSGLEHIIKTINIHNIDCDLYQNKYFIADSVISARRLINRIQNQLINGVHGDTQQDLYFERSDDVVLQDNTWCLDSTKYIRGLAENLLKNNGHIMENTNVTNITTGEYKEIHTNHGVIEANYVLVATGAQVIEESLKSKLLSIPTYLFYTKLLSQPINLPNNFAIATKDTTIHYFRYILDNKLILGCHPEINMSDIEFINQIKNQIYNMLPECHDVKFETVIAQDISLTSNYLPYVGQKDENTFFAHGCAGKGLAVGVAIGNAIANTIDGDNKDFCALANMIHHPIRKPPAQLITNRLDRLRDICL